VTFDTGRWVAIVDDDESIRRALTRLLRAHGIDVRAFHSARDYLGRARGVPACLCVDWFLNDVMNGFELTALLNAQGVSPPTIFITAQDQSELASVITVNRPIIILRKPLDAPLLLEFVLQHVGGDVSATAS
jgi:FixJ family two-component response regulator